MIDLIENFERAHAAYLAEARAAVNRGVQDEADAWALMSAKALVRSLVYFYSNR